MTAAQEPAPKLVELDERRRVALGKIAWPEHRLYLASVDDATGVITLAPVVIRPATRDDYSS